MKIKQKTIKIFLKLKELVDNNGGEIKIDNSDGCFMPVYIKKINNELYAISHCFLQNGDLIPDPYVEFKFTNNSLEPVRYQDYYGIQNKVDNNFVNFWLNNIKEQQNLKIGGI